MPATALSINTPLWTSAAADELDVLVELSLALELSLELELELPVEELDSSEEELDVDTLLVIVELEDSAADVLELCVLLRLLEFPVDVLLELDLLPELPPHAVKVNTKAHAMPIFTLLIINLSPNLWLVVDSRLHIFDAS